MSQAIKKTWAAFYEALVEEKQAGTIAEGAFQRLAAFAYASTRQSSGTDEPRQITFIKDANGATVAIFDYYFKRWMPLVGEEAVEFGSKASSATGLNNMCKLGVSLWTKQQRRKKQESADLLAKVEAGELEVEDIASEREAIEARAKEIEPTDLGFESRDEVVAYLEANGVDLTDTDYEE